MTSTRPIATATTLAATVALSVACWTFVIRQVSGMDMGVATAGGAFGPFILMWIAMMSAMMLPGLIPALARQAQANERLADMLGSVGPYLGMWGLVGILVFLVYRPHGTEMTGIVLIAAGAYELTPLKRRFRQHCGAAARPGLSFGLCCIGSSLGLMVAQVALGIMSIAWMASASVVMVCQKLLRPNWMIDVPLGLAIITLGVLIVFAPSLVPELKSAM